MSQVKIKKQANAHKPVDLTGISSPLYMCHDAHQTLLSYPSTSTEA